jgi:hypothetical protein
MSLWYPPTRSHKRSLRQVALHALPEILRFGLDDGSRCQEVGRRFPGGPRVGNWLYTNFCATQS